MIPESCVYCGVDLRQGDNRTIDHFIPRGKGGTNAKSNRVLACKFCNLLKEDRLFADVPSARKWMLKRAKLVAKRLAKQSMVENNVYQTPRRAAQKEHL